MGGGAASRLEIAAEVPRGIQEMVRNGLPLFEPKLPVSVVDRDDEFARLCAQLASEELIGLDVETTTDTHVLCLVQLSTRERVWIVDPLALASLEPLRPVLERAAPLKVIHYSVFEERVLGAIGFSLTGVFDTWEASRRKHGLQALGGHTLSAVCERELGVAIDKSEQASSWAARPLSRRQLHYAAVDAEVLLGLVDMFGPGT